MSKSPLTVQYRPSHDSFRLYHGSKYVASFRYRSIADRYCRMEFGCEPQFDIMVTPISGDDDVIHDSETGGIAVVSDGHFIGFFSSQALYLVALWECQEQQ